MEEMLTKIAGKNEDIKERKMAIKEQQVGDLSMMI